MIALAGIAVAVVFVATLTAFLLFLAVRLGSVEAHLASISRGAALMSGYCGVIGPAVGAMNTNLYGVAAELSAIGDEIEVIAPE